MIKTYKNKTECQFHRKPIRGNYTQPWTKGKVIHKKIICNGLKNRLKLMC